MTSIGIMDRMTCLWPYNKMVRRGVKEWDDSRGLESTDTGWYGEAPGL